MSRLAHRDEFLEIIRGFLSNKIPVHTFYSRFVQLDARTWPIEHNQLKRIAPHFWKCLLIRIAHAWGEIIDNDLNERMAELFGTTIKDFAFGIMISDIDACLEYYSPNPECGSVDLEYHVDENQLRAYVENRLSR